MIRDVEPLLRSPRVVTRGEFLAKDSPVPHAWGIYAWYFDRVPSVDVSSCHTADGRILLYAGIAPKSEMYPARGLNKRLRDHFRKNAEASTLRYSLGCLLADELGLELRLVGSTKRKVWVKGGEARLDTWLERHARVAWMECQTPWDVETRMLTSGLVLPLNIRDHMGRGSAVSRVREAHLNRAKQLPVIPKESGR